MKVKVLRDKDTKEFIHFIQMGEKTMVCTSELPNVQPLTATVELMKEIYPKEKFFDDFDNLDDYELVEFDLIEAGETGADIRNKLGSPKNLVILIELLLEEEKPDRRKKLKEFIQKEIIQTKKSVEYLAGLL